MSFFSESILTHSYQLWWWWRGTGTCSVGWRGWWSPSCLLSEKSQGRLQLCSQLKLISKQKLDYLWAKLPQGARVWSTVLQDGLLWMFSNLKFNSFPQSPRELSTTARCLDASAKFPERSCYSSIFPSCWATSDAFNDSARARMLRPYTVA